jgi:putative ABC transport system permease protein
MILRAVGGLLVLLLVAGVVALVGLLLFDVVRRPTFRGLALRNISRRRGEAALVIVGSLLGTAIITAAFVVGDTVEASIRDAARTSLGPIDESIRLTSADQLDPVTRAVTEPPIDGVDGTLALHSAGVVAATTGADRRSQPSAAMLEVDFDQARRFGTDPAITGLADAGPTPAGDQVVIGQKLADTLGIGPGSPIELFAYGGSKVFTVRQTVPEVGLAGYVPIRTSRFVSGTPAAIFVPPGTIDAMAGAGSAATRAASPPVTELLVSNVGGVFDSADRSSAVAAALNERVSASTGAQVMTLKSDLLTAAKNQGDSLTQLFRTVGFFSVIAGILLLVNLFVMLSEERKSELGMLRAVGFKRNHLVRTFAIEGAIYSVVAAVVGAFVGVLVGWAVVGATSNLFNQGSSTSYSVAVKPASLAIGALIGLTISMVTVWITSFRIARLNIIRAIRDLAEPAHGRSTWSLAAGVGMFTLGGLLFEVGWRNNVAGLVLGGPAIALFGLIFVLGRFLPRKPVTVVLSAVVLVWGIGVFALFPNKVSRAGIEVFVVQGVVLVAAGVAIVAQADRVWAWLARGAASAGGSVSARLGLAYPLARKFRTSLLLAMYSLVIFTLALITVLAGVLGDQGPAFVKEVRSGYDVLVDSSQGNPVTVAQLQAVPGVAAVAPLTRGLAQVSTPSRPDFNGTALTGFDASLIDQGQPELDSRGAAYATDADAFRAVLGDPNLIIVSGTFGGGNRGGGPQQNTLNPGDQIVLQNAATKATRPVTVAGVLSNDVVGNTGFVSKPFMQDLLGPLKVDNRQYVRVAPGADAEQVATTISGTLVQNGASAKTFLTIVNDNLQMQVGLFNLLRGYLGLGLLIGIAGLGVVMVRAVRERRREIGMLRAMGFGGPTVRRSFVLEAAFIAVQGIVLGVSLGLVTAYNLITKSDTFSDGSTIAINWPWVALIIVAAIPFVASLLATAWPATQASRIRPAVALRIAD